MMMMMMVRMTRKSNLISKQMADRQVSEQAGRQMDKQLL